MECRVKEDVPGRYPLISHVQDAIEVEGFIERAWHDHPDEQYTDNLFQVVNF